MVEHDGKKYVRMIVSDKPKALKECPEATGEIIIFFANKYRNEKLDAALD